MKMTTTTTTTSTTTTTTTFALTLDSVRLSEESFSNTPSSGLALLHRMASTHNECGFQALLIFDSSARLPDSYRVDPVIVEDLSCHLLVCSPMDTFYKPETVPDHFKMTMSIENYLDLYAFIHCKWPSVLAQMIKNASCMADGKEWVRIKPYLLFLNDGVCQYKALLGPDLIFFASIDSQNVVKTSTPGKNCKDFIVQVSIQKGNQTFNLPLSTVSKLFSNTEAYQHIQSAYLMACKRKSPAVPSQTAT